MFSSAPIATTIMNGKPSHVFVMTFAENDVKNDPIHETPSSPAAFSNWLMPPYSVLNMPFQISAVM